MFAKHGKYTEGSYSYIGNNARVPAAHSESFQLVSLVTKDVSDNNNEALTAAFAQPPFSVAIEIDGDTALALCEMLKSSVHSSGRSPRVDSCYGACLEVDRDVYLLSFHLFSGGAMQFWCDTNFDLRCSFRRCGTDGSTSCRIISEALQ